MKTNNNSQNEITNKTNTQHKCPKCGYANYNPDCKCPNCDYEDDYIDDYYPEYDDTDIELARKLNIPFD